MRLHCICGLMYLCTVAIEHKAVLLSPAACIFPIRCLSKSYCNSIAPKQDTEKPDLQGLRLFLQDNYLDVDLLYNYKIHE